MARFHALLLVAVLLFAVDAPARQSSFVRFPASNASNINPDTHLVLAFSSEPRIGRSGQIRIYDGSTDRVVDTLDLSIPPGPTDRAQGPAAPYTPAPYQYESRSVTNANTVPGTPSGAALPTPRDYQLSIIGGFSDGFHFYPVIVHGNEATIHLHHNLLEYNKTYYVQIDPGVLSVADGSFTGIGGKQGWRFSTKTAPPPDSSRLVVALDGTGDFNTVQGAIDFVPDRSRNHATIFIRNGAYEEIVYFRNKSNVTFLGEDRDNVVILYANNEVFNPHPSNISTNEWPGTFPSRRAVFMADNSSDIQLVNLTIRNTTRGQAEGLLLMGERYIVSHVTVVGSGDALQANGPVYLTDSRIVGDGDTILGRGPAFFNHCELESRGVFMWIRNTDANHGNVFLNSTFRKLGGGTTELARAPINNGRGYPFAEAVLINATLDGISPAGWGAMGGDTANMRYWEFNSRDLEGRPIDVSLRKPESLQLTMEKDAETIANYGRPEYVLGWKPAMAPVILRQPEGATVEAGQTVALAARVAGIPEATAQWFRNGVPIPGATQPALEIRNIQSGDVGRYTVALANASGSVTSRAAVVIIR
ncbi:MAG TPA: pectinesterase family protein [Terriglobia bacterium]|nr:pectinesterase family protein [Terriglobia bacterium]